MENGWCYYGYGNINGSYLSIQVRLEGFQLLSAVNDYEELLFSHLSQVTAKYNISTKLINNYSLFVTYCELP